MSKNLELKWAYNTRTGITRELPPAIYNNPIRMRERNWQLLEGPPPMEQNHEPVAVNMPVESERIEATITIPGRTEGTVPAAMEMPTNPVVPKPIKPKNKNR